MTSPDHITLTSCGFNDAGDAMMNLEQAVTRLVEVCRSPAGKTALTDLAPTLLWQRYRLGNVLEQIGVPLLRAAS